MNRENFIKEIEENGFYWLGRGYILWKTSKLKTIYINNIFGIDFVTGILVTKSDVKPDEILFEQKIGNNNVLGGRILVNDVENIIFEDLK